MLVLLLLIVLQILYPADLYGDDPPTILWTEEYASYFYDVHETADGGFIVAGRKGEGPDKSVFLFDSNGDLLWEYGVSGYDYYQHASWVEELPGGGFIATGKCQQTSAHSYALFLAKLSPSGVEEWVRIYDLSDSHEQGYCVLPLPDGGFLVTGRVNGYSSIGGQAWILRTDSSGDTLWTDIWGEHTVNYAKRSFLINDSLKVLTYGRIHPDSSRGPHILTYDMDGNLTRETQIPDIEGYECPDMCHSPTDDSYTLITYTSMLLGPRLYNVDDIGNVLWWSYFPAYETTHGRSINSTMDGGYICGGNNYSVPDIQKRELFGGIVARYDSDGNRMWHDFRISSSCIYSVRQLSQGGYIAAGYGGSKGLLIRYAPEVGIEEGGTLPAQVTLHHPSPNPFTSSLSVSYSIPESMQVSLSVYDVSGRMVGELENSVMVAGEHTFAWDPGVLPSGCYLVRLVTEHGEFVRSSVLIR